MLFEGGEELQVAWRREKKERGAKIGGKRSSNSERLKRVKRLVSGGWTIQFTSCQLCDIIFRFISQLASASFAELTQIRRKAQFGL